MCFSAEESLLDNRRVGGPRWLFELSLGMRVLGWGGWRGIVVRMRVEKVVWCWPFF